MPRKSTKKTVNLVEETATAQEEQVQEIQETVESNAPTNRVIIDIDWQHVQPIFEFKQQLVQMEEYFGQMCLRFEKNKANIMSQIIYGQNDLYAMAENLQKDLNIDSSITYELKLPTESGQKGFFVRKDD